MIDTSYGRMLSLLTARRLLLRAHQDVQGKTKPAHGKEAPPTAKEALAEDEALLSGGALTQDPGRPAPEASGTRIRLSDLASRLRELRQDPQGVAAGSPVRSETAVASLTQQETEVTIQVEVNEPVSGLVRRDQHLAESDRYRFEFVDGATFRITDKWSGKSTTIWGDPHVDTSDEEGSSNGEFSDLRGSDQYTTLKLQDGTQVTFTAKDNGVIEAVDIVKGSQHLRGIGSAAKDWSEERSLFADPVDSAGAGSAVPTGDLVIAGGDGNDWFDAAGRLVWGKTTGPVPSPTVARVEVSVVQRTTQVTVAQHIDDWA
jgi:hypothetical protein